MTNKEFNKDELRKAMRKKYFSKEDIMIKGKKVDFETSIKGNKLSELMYGKQEPQSPSLEIWENFRRYN